MKIRRKKRALTLLEIMIVIFLITLITGAIGYNMKGSLDKGRVFRTNQAKLQLEDMFQLALTDEKVTVDKIKNNPGSVLKSLGFAKDADKLLKDGWGDRFEIVANARDRTVTISSKNLAKYEKNHSLKEETEDSQEE